VQGLKNKAAPCLVEKNRILSISLLKGFPAGSDAAVKIKKSETDIMACELLIYYIYNE